MDKFLNLLKTFYEKIKPYFKSITAFFKKHNEVVIPTAVLSIICIVVTLALSSTNLLTAKRISSLAENNRNEAMAKVIVADQYTPVTETFTNEISTEEITYNVAVKGGKTIGYIFTVSTKGYGGDVSVMTAVNTDGTVAAINILDASGETPGLGQNVTKDSFFNQYSGLKTDITISKSEANKENNEVQAVTGATISSRAVTNSVNKALEYAAQIIAKGATK